MANNIHPYNRQALVYQDTGVSSESAEALAKQFRSILDKSIEVKKVDSKYLIQEDWEKNTVALGMGGGVCRIWEENLGQKGMERIHDYVFKEGGKVILFCAGAYFGSEISAFNANEKRRPLKFFAGRAIGPLVEAENHLSLEAARAAKVAFNVKDKVENGYVYYQGGCAFEFDENETPGTYVVARYQDLAPGKAAAVLCECGNGMAFLSGVHPEYSWSETSDKSHPHFVKLAETLSKQEPFRTQIWREIGRHLKLPLEDNILRF